jgi:hypothetical protein
MCMASPTMVMYRLASSAYWGVIELAYGSGW